MLIFFVWITDVMFGPVFGSPDRLAGRVFPTHFLTMWMTGLPSACPPTTPAGSATWAGH